MLNYGERMKLFQNNQQAIVLSSMNCACQEINRVIREGLYYCCLLKKAKGRQDHLQNPLISIVSNPLHHIHPEGVHQLIMGFPQDLACCLCQPQDEVVTGGEVTFVILFTSSDSLLR